MGKTVKININLEITNSDIFKWIENFLTERSIKENHRILMTHEFTNDLADYLINEMNKKLLK